MPSLVKKPPRPITVEANRQADLAAYKAWLDSHRIHPDRPHVLRLVCQLETSGWDTSGWEPVEDEA